MLQGEQQLVALPVPFVLCLQDLPISDLLDGHSLHMLPQLGRQYQFQVVISRLLACAAAPLVGYAMLKGVY